MLRIHRRNRSWVGARHYVAASLLAFIGVAAGPVMTGHASAKLPFYAGEELTFRMRMGGLGTVAMGTMSVSKPTSLRGIPALLLTSEFDSKVAIFGGRDRTRSWIEQGRLRVLRYEKSERTPFSRREESVDVFPDERRWVAKNGDSGRTPTDAPLDELSFIYFIRTLDLDAGDTYWLDRHFEKDRNPVVVKVLGREKIEVGAGTFDAVVVEMRVRDPSRHEGEAVLRLHLTDDGCRLPLRIESEVPTFGKTVLTLEGHNHPASHRTGR